MAVEYISVFQSFPLPVNGQGSLPKNWDWQPKKKKLTKKPNKQWQQKSVVAWRKKPVYWNPKGRGSNEVVLALHGSTPSIRRRKQENCSLEVSLGYTARLSRNKTKQNVSSVKWVWYSVLCTQYTQIQAYLSASIKWLGRNAAFCFTKGKLSKCYLINRNAKTWL